MIELSPDYNAYTKEQIANKTNTYIESVTNQLGGALLVTQPQLFNDLLSNQLISSQKNYGHQNTNGIQDITSFLQPYSVSDANIQVPLIKPSLQSLKRIEILQRNKQRLNTFNQITLGSQGLIQHQSDLVLNIQNSKQKQQNQEQEIYYDSSLDTSDIRFQQPMHINNLLPFNQYFHEEDLFTYQSMPSSIDHNLIAQKSNTSQNIPQNQKAPTRHLTYAQKIPQSSYMQQLYDENKCIFQEAYSQNFSSFSNQYISQKNTEEVKNNEGTTMGKIFSDLSVSIKPDKQSISKKSQQNQNNGFKQNSIKSMVTGGIFKQIENKQENNIKKQTYLAGQNIYQYFSLYEILDEKCYEIDSLKNYLIYFPQYNFDIIIKKYNIRNKIIQKKPQFKPKIFSLNKKDYINKQSEMRPSLLHRSSLREKELNQQIK